MTRHALAFLSVVVLAVPVASQGVSVVDGNVKYTQRRPLATQTDSPTAFFTARNAAPIPSSVLYENGWFYRIEGDPTNRPLRDDGTLTVTNAGDKATALWSNVDNRSRISIRIDYHALSTGARRGVVVQRATVRNISFAPVTVHLFHYVDVEVGGGELGYANDSAVGSARRQIITDPDFPNDTVYSYAGWVDNSCVRAFEFRECGIIGPLATNLDGTTPPFGPGDYTSAVQWTDENVEPGKTRLHTVALGFNEKPCEWSYDIYGVSTPSGQGPITVEPDPAFPPVVGNTGFVSVGKFSNWPLLPTARRMLLLFALDRANVPIPALGLTLLVSAPLSTRCEGPFIVGDFPILMDPGFIPNNPSLCTASLHIQALAVDSCIPTLVDGHPKAVTWIIGSLNQ